MPWSPHLGRGAILEVISNLRRWWFWLKVGPPLVLVLLILMVIMGAAVGQTDSAGLVVAAQPIQGAAPGSYAAPGGVLAQYAPAIAEASKETGVEPELIEAVIMAESGGDPNALSPVGAIGLMQLMPDTAEALGITNPWDPTENILGGTRHLAGLLRAAPTWPVDDGTPSIWLAVAAYNAGEGAVLKYHGVPPYPETQGYVTAVAQYYEGFKALALASAGGEQAAP